MLSVHCQLTEGQVGKLVPPCCFWAAFQEALWPEYLQFVKHWVFTVATDHWCYCCIAGTPFPSCSGLARRCSALA